MLRFLPAVGLGLICAAAPAELSAQSAASRPSFTCGRSITATERMICGDAELARLDRIVADLYSEIRSLTLNAEQRRQVEAEQRAWLGRRNACRQVSCLRQGHFGRINELAGQLPTDS